LHASGERGGSKKERKERAPEKQREKKEKKLVLTAWAEGRR
jgi:hypothetical protein